MDFVNFYEGSHPFPWILGKFHHDLTVLPSPGNDGVVGKSFPFMAQQVRSMKYDNLARWILCGFSGFSHVFWAF